MNAEQTAPARADRIEERGGKYVVVSKESGRTFGTYATREQAERRLAQIEAFSDDEMMRELDEIDGYARKGDKYESLDFSPPEAVSNAAKRGLDFRQRAGGRGGLTTSEAGEQGIGSGVARATSLSKGGEVSPATVRRMAAFFSRHEKNKAIAPEHKDEPWRDAGHVAWLLWGGDAGRKWADRLVARMNAEDERKGDRMDRWDDCGVLTLHPTRGDAEAAPVDGARAWIDDATGFLHAVLPIARTGTQVYKDSNGSAWTEYRAPAEVFNADSMASFERAPITVDHPTAPVTVDTVGGQQVGSLGSTLRREGRYLLADAVITDAATIEAVKNGRQVSAGYSARILAEGGVSPDGERYDARQTMIRANHLALVERGRAGPRVALPPVGRNANTTPAQTEKDDTMSEQMKTDAATVPAGRIAELEAQIAALTARADSAEADATAAKQQAEQARTDAAQQVAARVEIVSQATPILGRVDSSMSDSAIMRAVVVKVRPGLEAKLDAHADSPGYLRACFDDALEAHARNAENSAVIGLAAAHAATASERGDSLDDLRDAYIASMGRK